MKYFFIAGEASGDMHASNLMYALKKLDKKADFRYCGGDLMQSVGGTLIKHYRNIAFMGFIPVLLNLRTIHNSLKHCKKEIKNYKPDIVILVDYPSFNIRIAKKIKVPHLIYYISPKIWAWKKYRIKDIKKYIDKMICILPFEVNFYKEHQFEVDYIGNPTIDAIENRKHKKETFEEFIRINQLENKPIIALLAGSRKQEIKDNLPIMIKASVTFNEYQLVLAGAPGIDIYYYKQLINNYPIHIVFGQTYRLLQQAKVALVTSGTATLETALLRVPQVVCYKLPLKLISTFVFKYFFSCKYISLVNLIADKTIVKELFGKSFSISQIRDELNLLLYDSSYRKKMDEGYQEVIDKLGKPGASDRAAQRIYTLLSNRKS